MKLVLLSIVVELDHMFTYKKIFINQQHSYKNQLDIDMKLAKTINAESTQLSQVGFLPDNLSFLNSNGINIYQANIDSKSYGYFGVRGIRLNNINLIKQQKLYYKMLLENKNINTHQLKTIDLFGNNLIDQVFFFDANNFLWRYDVLKDKLFLQNSNSNNINYIVGSDIFNIISRQSDFQSKYIIYLHYKEANQDIIKIIHQCNEDSRCAQSIDIIKSKQAIMKFFLRSNYIIILYQNLDIEPQIYKIYYKNNIHNILEPSIVAKKIDIKLNLYKKEVLLNCIPGSNLPKYELLWDVKLNAHRISVNQQICQTINYVFNLPNDKNILSFKSSDY